MNKEAKERNASLIDRAGITESLELAPGTENAWIEVIHKMDSVYADLVRYQVELEQKNSELEEAQQFIGSVLSSMTDILIVCDISGRIQQVNSALERLTGKPLDAFLGKPIGEVFEAESDEIVAQFPERLSCVSLIDCEVSLLCADGTTAPLAMNCSSRYDHEGALVGAVLIGRPVGELRRAYDELKQTQQQLLHSEKMASLGRLVAGVAHELNNPISFVFGNMHALRRYGGRITEYLTAVESQVDSPKLQQLRHKLKIDRIMNDMAPLIDGTMEGAERVSDIVQELRSYSGAQKEECSRFDLPASIRKAVEWVVKACRIKPEVDYRLPDELEISSRRGQVHQILVNLIQNAVDAMEGMQQPRLVLNCEAQSYDVTIKVIDQGSGIAAKDLAQLFDPFFTTKPVGQGTGLGLYICYDLAHDLGGNLTANNHPDGGAVFTLTLPVSNKDES